MVFEAICWGEFLGGLETRDGDLATGADAKSLRKFAGVERAEPKMFDLSIVELYLFFIQNRKDRNNTFGHGGRQMEGVASRPCPQAAFAVPTQSFLNF
jgi:hypothetical protein